MIDITTPDTAREALLAEQDKVEVLVVSAVCLGCGIVATQWATEWNTPFPQIRTRGEVRTGAKVLHKRWAKPCDGQIQFTLEAIDND